MGTLPLLFALALTPSAHADSDACAPAGSPAAGTVSDLQEAVAATDDKPNKPAAGDSWLDSIGSWGSKVSESVSDAVSDLQSQLAPTAEERAAIESLVGRPLSTPLRDAGADALRRVCGALLASPQFLLQGLEPLDGATSEGIRLVVPEVSSAGLCTSLAAALPAVTCDGETLHVAP